jgi:hypothetical protein
VAIDGDQIVVGALEDDNGNLYTGAAYVFTRAGDRWTQKSKLVASDRSSGSYFGDDVAIKGDIVIVGAAFANDYSGAAYVFSVSDSPAPAAVPMFIRSLGDINGDGSQDIVVLANKDGTLTAKVKDAKDRHWIKTIRFDNNLVPVDLEVMPDINGNGAPELAVLGSGGMRSEVRDSLTGKKLGYVDFDPNLAAIDLELVTDLTGNDVLELAMLGR